MIYFINSKELELEFIVDSAIGHVGWKKMALHSVEFYNLLEALELKFNGARSGGISNQFNKVPYLVVDLIS